MLCRNYRAPNIQALLKVSRWCLLRVLSLFASTYSISPSRKQYSKVQVDELWSFARRRKYWLLYAYAPENDGIITFICGSRSEQIVRKLYEQLKDIDIGYFCIDNCKAFQAVFPQSKYLIGKHYTKNIEGVITSLRTQLLTTLTQALGFQGFYRLILPYRTEVRKFCY